MGPGWKLKTGYQPVAPNDSREPSSAIEKARHDVRLVSSWPRRCYNAYITYKPVLRVLLNIFLVACLILSLVAVLWYYHILIWAVHKAFPSECRTPAIRREWRMLSTSQRDQYIRAVKCLRNVPSELAPESNGSRFDDFSWTYQEVGSAVHETASFLAWHRYFLHVYETALRESCYYSGPLPYWDWSADWRDPSKSPVFSSISGFGRNGDLRHPATHGDGFCLMQGPFAGAKSSLWDNKNRYHCLSRNIANDTAPGHFSGDLLRPQNLDDILAEHGYIDMLLALENGPHKAVSKGIGGDFARFTAPSDPLFFLHLAQLDRIWWIWQQKSKSRTQAYSGPASSNDPLAFQGLAPDVQVSKMMDVEGGLLCYRYDRTSLGDEGLESCTRKSCHFEID